MIKGKKSKADQKSQARSLAQFVRDKRKEGCSICALNVTVRGQLADGPKKKISRDDQIEWLHRDIKVKITKDDLVQHVNGRHDAA